MVKNLVELFVLSMMDMVRYHMFHLFLLGSLPLSWFSWLICMFLAIVTGSPDRSILATDVETGSVIARLENSHGWVLILSHATSM